MRGSSLMSNRGLRTTYALSMRAHPPPPRVVWDEAWGRSWWLRHVARSQRLRSLGRELVAGWRRYAYQGQRPAARWPPARVRASPARRRVVSRCSVVYICCRVALVSRGVERMVRRGHGRLRRVTKGEGAAWQQQPKVAGTQATATSGCSTERGQRRTAGERPQYQGAATRQ